MPELPDVVVYIESLRPRVVGRVLQRVRLASPFVLRSVTPPIREAEGRAVTGVRRIGNAYSDEILHRARLSPLRLTRQLEDEEVARLRAATRDVLTEWTERL